jgi:tRNA nucleotidyltransferase (CCA-adding enzyme)
MEDPSRLIRAARFAARFHWPLEERTQARVQSAKENNYIEYITDRAIGQEIEQLAYEDDPLHIVRVLEKEEWLKVLNPHWSTAKMDASGLGQLIKTRQQMSQLGYATDPSPAVLYFLTARLGDKDIADMRKLIPRKDLVAAWKDLEDNAKSLAKRLTGKEAATPSRTWKLLSEARPEMVLFLEVTAKQQAVAQKIKNFFGKWRQVQQKLPLLEMTELRITPQMPEYPKIAHDVFMLLLDGKLHSRTEILKFLKPLSPPPPPPPPPPPKRGRAAKAAAVQPAAVAVPVAGKKKGKVAVSPLPPPAAKVEVAKLSSPPKVEKHSSPKKTVPGKTTASGKKKAKGPKTKGRR